MFAPRAGGAAAHSPILSTARTGHPAAVVSATKGRSVSRRPTPAPAATSTRSGPVGAGTGSAPPQGQGPAPRRPTHPTASAGGTRALAGRHKCGWTCAPSMSAGIPRRTRPALRKGSPRLSYTVIHPLSPHKASTPLVCLSRAHPKPRKNLQVEWGGRHRRRPTLPACGHNSAGPQRPQP